MPENKGTILYVGGFELPDKNAAAHRVLNNAKIFRELGFNVVFCGVNREITSDENYTELISGFDSMPTSYPASAKQWIKQMLDSKHYMKMFSLYKDIRLVICYNLHSVPLARLLHFCKKRGIKLIVDCTEWYENKFSLNPIKLIKCVDTFLCMRVFQKKCDGMIAISSYLADYYKRSVKHTVVVPPLVDLEDEKFIFGGEKPQNEITTLVYSGSPSASKELLGEVVKCLNNITDLDFRLKIVGIDYEQFCSMYNALPDREKIEFMGRVPHKNALQTVRESDYAIIIRPKTRVTMAGFPTKFAEAISVGTAVIANATSDLADYLKDGNNGYLVDTNNLEKELRNILMAQKKNNVNKEQFYYKKYLSLFKKYFGNIGL